MDERVAGAYRSTHRRISVAPSLQLARGAGILPSAADDRPIGCEDTSSQRARGTIGVRDPKGPMRVTRHELYSKSSSDTLDQLADAVVLDDPPVAAES